MADGATLAAELDAELRRVSPATTDALRAARKRWSARLKPEPAALVLDLAFALLRRYARRWVAYEIVRFHPAAFAASPPHMEAFAEGLNDWYGVDAFGRILSGPAWLRGWLDDGLIAKWAASPDLWLRRTALVSTVALNAKTDGGAGDATRTLRVCQVLVADREDMVVKAMSWALRELAVRDRGAVEAFLSAHETELAARVKREVRHKMTTGLKTPKVRR